MLENPVNPVYEAYGTNVQMLRASVLIPPQFAVGIDRNRILDFQRLVKEQYRFTTNKRATVNRIKLDIKKDSSTT